MDLLLLVAFLLVSALNFHIQPFPVKSHQNAN